MVNAPKWACYPLWQVAQQSEGQAERISEAARASQTMVVLLRVPTYFWVKLYGGFHSHGGTPISSTLLGFSITNHLFWGTYIEKLKYLKVTIRT